MALNDKLQKFACLTKTDSKLSIPLTSKSEFQNGSGVNVHISDNIK